MTSLKFITATCYILVQCPVVSYILEHKLFFLAKTKINGVFRALQFSSVHSAASFEFRAPSFSNKLLMLYYFLNKRLFFYNNIFFCVRYWNQEWWIIFFGRFFGCFIIASFYDRFLIKRSHFELVFNGILWELIQINRRNGMCVEILIDLYFYLLWRDVIKRWIGVFKDWHPERWTTTDWYL